MSLPYITNERAVLIGDPDPARYAFLHKIFAEQFETAAEQATTFSELQQRAQESQRWRLVIFTDNLPVATGWHNVLVSQYARALDERWSERLVGVLGTGEPPALIGVERAPLWLRVPAGVTAASAPPVLAQYIAQRLWGLQRVWPSQLRPAASQPATADFKALAELDALLARQMTDIDRVRQRTLASQQSSERLGQATDAALAAFKEWAHHAGDSEKHR
jgi:hypothetical protein